MDRFDSCDFLLTFHCNYGHILYRFQDIQRFLSKITYFAYPLKGFPLELGTGAGGQKTRIMVLPGRQRKKRRYLQPSGQNAQTWQTDGWTPGHSKDRAYAYRRAEIKLLFIAVLKHALAKLKPLIIFVHLDADFN